MTNQRRIPRGARDDNGLRSEVTLGILAGGQASRLGGIDKAWLVRDGLSQVLRIAQRFAPRVRTVIVSANRNLERYAAAGLRTISDADIGIGPLAGLAALASACATPWLLTVPVDIIDPDEHVSARLLAAGEAKARGAFIEDDDGVQPLFALWPAAALRAGAADAIASGDFAIRSLQARLGMQALRLTGLRLGNLNTPADLVAAGIEAGGVEPA